MKKMQIRMQLVCLFSMLLLFFPVELFAQQGTITGKVVDERGESVIGATVMVKGSTDGTITDLDGNFKINGKVGTTITVSYVGYAPLEVKITKLTGNRFVMKEDSKTLDEVVVVGYGAKKNKKSTTLGSVVKVEEQAEKEITPQPVIGKRSYQKYLKENLVRPADEKCAQVKGKVVLTFLVNKEGRPFYIKVKESLCESADKEAIRLIQEGPDWIYGNKLAEVTVKFE